MSDAVALEVLSDVVSKLEDLGIEYAIGGSTASGVWGQPRYTNDIDLSLSLSIDQSRAFLESFSADYLISESELAEALTSSDHFRMVQALHMEKVFKIDFFLMGDTPFERSVIERAQSVTLVPGLQCRFQSPEDAVLYKLRWYTLGNRVSERQWNDVVQVLEVQAHHLDLDYLRHWAEQFDVLDLLEAALREGAPVEE